MAQKLKFVTNPERGILVKCLSEKCLLCDWSTRQPKDDKGKVLCRWCNGHTQPITIEESAGTKTKIIDRRP